MTIADLFVAFTNLVVLIFTVSTLKLIKRILILKYCVTLHASSPSTVWVLYVLYSQRHCMFYTVSQFAPAKVLCRNAVFSTFRLTFETLESLPCSTYTVLIMNRMFYQTDNWNNRPGFWTFQCKFSDGQGKKWNHIMPRIKNTDLWFIADFPERSLRAKLKTYTADCRKIAAVDSNKHDWHWKKRYWKKKRFLYKNIFKFRFILMAFRSWTYFCFLERGHRGYYQYQ